MHEEINNLLSVVEIEVNKTLVKILKDNSNETYGAVTKKVHQERFRASNLGNHIIDALINDINFEAKNQLVGEIANTNN